MSLIKCLRKLKLDAHEAALIKTDTQDLTLEGIEARDAAIQAINNRIEEYNTERQDILTQLEDQGANIKGIQVEEITDETAIQELLAKFQKAEPAGISQREADLRTISGGQVRQGFVSETSASDDTGQLLTLHRGASIALHSDHFSKESLGKGSGKAPSGLGVWLTTEIEHAAGYGVVEQFHVDIRNPKPYTVETFPEYETLDEYHAHREDLSAQGFDGIVLDFREIEGGLQYIAFEPEQVVTKPKEYFQEKRAVQQDGPRERRRTAREAFEELSKEELITQILAHELTGIKGRKAFEVEVQDAKAVGSIDADSLKWVNDNLSPEHGDTLLQAVADALESETDQAYHISGDEFYVLGDNQEEVQAAIEKATEKLSKAIITAEKPDGSIITLNGLNITHGLGETKNAADQTLKTEKTAREQRGERAARGEPPLGAIIEPAERIEGVRDVSVEEYFQEANIDTPEFKKWFGDSKVVDNKNDPLVVYHGTAEKFEAFDPERSIGGQYWFTTDKAGIEAGEVGAAGKGVIVEAYLSLQNPAGWKEYDNLTLDELIARGYDGLALPDSDGTTTYVAFEPTQIKSPESVGFDPSDPRMLFQEKRGSIQFGDQKTIINLFKSRNLSTFLHESGHLFLDVMQDISSRPDATPELVEEWTKVEAFLGVEAGAKLTTEQHEKWATSFEAYLREGKAPSAELRGAFQTFRRWLLDVYKSVKKLLGEDALTDDIRGIFDRMLATDEQLQAAQSDGYEAIFKSAEEMGFTDKEFSDYKAVEKEVHERAQEDLDVEAIKEVQRERKEEWKNAKAKVQTEVELEVNQRKAVRAKHFLMTGEFLPGDPMGEVITSPVKIDKNELKAMYEGTDFIPELRRLPVGKSQITAVEGGLHPDVVAEMLGYKSGDRLIKAILEAGNRKQTIKTEVNARMSAEYGDIRTDLDRVSEMAIDALHSDKRAHFLMLELKALNKRTGAGKTQASVLKDVAYRLIDESGVPEAARVERFLADERKNGRKAEQAIIDQDFNAARDAKRQQILSHYLYMAARDAKAEQAKFLRFFDKFKKKGTRKSLKGEHLDQIDQLLEKYDFRKVSLKAVEERQSLRLWVESQKNDGLIPNVSDQILDDIRTSYKELTMGEFRGVYDAIKSIEAIARTENKIKVAQEMIDYESVIQELIEAAYESNKVGDAPPFDKGIEGAARQVGSLIKGFDSTLLKTEQMIAWLDGDKPEGPWHKYLFRTLAEAEHARNDLDVVYTTKLIEALEGLPKEQAKRFHDKIFVTSLGMDMTYSGLVSMALNMGTESNFFKLVDGSQRLETGGFTAEQATDAVNKHLTEADWQFVDSIWKILDGYGEEKSLFTMLNEVEKEITGTPVKKVKARKVVTPYGTLDGGYYPIAYSPTESKVRREIGEEFSGRPSTTSGSVNERIETYSAPLDLDLHAIPLHISEITQDVTHRRAVMDVWKIVTDQRIRRALQKTLGKEYEPQFQKWVAHVANDKMTDQTGVGAWMRLIRAARLNTSIVAMGFKWTTMVQQPLGITQSIDTFRTMEGGKMYLTKEVANFAKHPLEMKEMVFEKSGEMRHRMSNLDRDLRENLRKRLGRKDAHAEMVRYAFMGIGLGDMVVSLPTWTASYKWAIDNKHTEAQAVEWADSRVRLSQGSGSAKDLSAVQRGHEAMKLLTVFYSYFNAYYQRIRDSGRMTKSIKDAPDLLLRHWYITIIPAIFSELMSGRGPDEDEELEDWAARQIIAYPFQTIPFVRDVAGAVESGYGYDWTPAGGVGEHTVRLFNKADDFLEGDADFSDVLGQAVKTSGYFLGLPTGQATITFNHMMDAIEGDSDFNPYYLLVREPKQ